MIEILIEAKESIINFFTVVIEFAPKFLPGVWTTLQLSVFSILLGTIFALGITVLKVSNRKILIKIADVYISIVRGTPLLLQLFFIFYALPRMGLEFNRFVSAVIGLALHNAAYISEIFRGAINSIHYGQEEAAKALGMNKIQIFKHVILPQAFKISVPSLGNQFIIAVKDSSLASAITITETMLLARQYVAATFEVFPIFFVAGMYYYLIITILTKLLKKLELKLKINER